MKARLFILGADPAAADQSFDEILLRTFADVLTDNGAMESFSTLKDATVSIGKAFSDSDTVIFFADGNKLAETKEILCKALGLELSVNEDLLAAALENASPEEMDSAYFNVCHAGVPAGAHVFVLNDSLYAGFACKRGRQTVFLLPYSCERTRVLLLSQVLPYIAETCGVKISPVPLQFYFAEKLSASVKRENIRIALAGTKTAEVFTRYLSYVPSLEGCVIASAKAEKRGGTPPNEYVVNLSITAAELLGLPYGVAISNAFYVGDDPEARKTVFIAVTNDSETTVRELHSFYGESTGDFLFRCCGELCRLLSKIIDADAGLAPPVEAAPGPRKKGSKKSGRGVKRAIAAVLVLILLVCAGGGWYFHTHNYTLRDWADKYLPIISMLRGEEEAPSGSTPAQTETADSAGDVPQ